MLLSTFILFGICVLIDHTLLTRKKPRLHCLFIFLFTITLTLAIGSLAKQSIQDLFLLKYIYYLIVFLTSFAYIYLVFKESISKKIFTLFSVWLFSIVVLYIATLIAGMFDEKHAQNLIFILRTCFMFFILLALHLGLNKSYINALGVVSNRTISFMSLYPIAAFLLLIGSYGASIGSFKNFNSIFEILFFVSFVMLGYLLVFVGIISSSKIVSLQYNYKIIENQIDLQRQNYKTLNESLEQLHAVKHDMRHHFSAIKAMLDEHKYSQATEYIEQFNQNELSNNISSVCQNFTADSIIKYYISVANSKDIDFIPNLIIPEDIGINSLDLCVVLGNCLENAIEACEKLEANQKKFIKFSSQIVNSHIVFTIINRFEGKIIKNGDMIQSTKKGEFHGIGFSSVKETVNKYKGNLDIKYSADEFEVDIIMNIGLIWREEATRETQRRNI